MKVLVVDDDPKLRDTLRRGLAESGIECDLAADADEAAARVARNGPYALLLLDVMMPGRSGYEFLEALRAGGDETPVLFLTARNEVDDRVRGLRLGADDYVIKPFELRELLARMEAVLRRHEHVRKLEVGDVVLDPVHRTVVRRGERVELSPREFEVLLALAEAPGRVLSRAVLLQRVWGIEFDPGTNLVDVQVARLRRKLHRSGPPIIETVIGEGYRLSPVAAPAP